MVAGGFWSSMMTGAAIVPRLMPYWAIPFMNGPVTRSATICSTALAVAGLAT